MNVHLVDGTFELFRCFHGAPRATSADGAEVGAVRGLRRNTTKGVGVQLDSETITELTVRIQFFV